MKERGREKGKDRSLQPEFRKAGEKPVLSSLQQVRKEEERAVAG